MKNKKIDIINNSIIDKIKRLPKSISRNERLQKNDAERIEIIDDKLDTLLKEGKYEDAIKYKEDLVLRNKFNIKKDNLQ